MAHGLSCSVACEIFSDQGSRPCNMSPALAGRFLTTAPPGKSPHSFDYCSFVVSFEIRKCECSSFLSFSRWLWLLGSLEIPYEFYGGKLRRAGPTLHCGAQASHCNGFSCFRARALGVRASVVVAHGLQ